METSGTAPEAGHDKTKFLILKTRKSIERSEKYYI